MPAGCSGIAKARDEKVLNVRLSHNPVRCKKVIIDPPQIDPERPADPVWARAEREKPTPRGGCVLNDV